MKAKYRYITFILAFFICSQYCFGQSDPKLIPIINQFGKELSADLIKDNLHGSISVAILKDNQIIWSGAFGYASSEKNIAADTSTIYRIGSVTKTFTAVLLMQLVEEGKVKLDDPVENYLPEIKYLPGYNGYEKITFRKLASHTSGLKREPDMKGADVGPLDQWERKVLTCIPYTSFNSRSGQAFLYSNIGYALLGLALSRVSGVPYIQMVQRRILTRLHMDDTFFMLPDDALPRLAEGLDNNNGQLNTSLPLREIGGRGYRVPNGGIYSTPRDLSKFVMSLMGSPSLLTDKSRQEMQTVQPGSKNYGLGLMVFNNRLIGHNGSVPGYTAQFAIDEQSGYAVILLRNYNKGNTNLEEASVDLLRKLKKVE